MSKSKDLMGNRMKAYEEISTSAKLIPRLPICVRVDGRAFHTFTRGMAKPYDNDMCNAMILTMGALVQETHAMIGYVQSDEISLVLPAHDEPLFQGKLSKLNSVIASIATAKFNSEIHRYYPEKPLAYFDCRVWNVPDESEAANVLLWREFDCIKNSVSMACHANKLDGETFKKNTAEKIEILAKHGIDWNEYPDMYKYGTFARRETIELKLSKEDLDQLPPMHDARKNPDKVYTRELLNYFSLPDLKHAPDKAKVLFHP